MIAGRIRNATRYLGAPPGWKPDKDGHCGHLAICDEQHISGPCMTSAWEPTPDEIERLAQGAPVYLTILGNVHPPVAMAVGSPPEAANRSSDEDLREKIAREIGTFTVVDGKGGPDHEVLADHIGGPDFGSARVYELTDRIIAIAGQDAIQMAEAAQGWKMIAQAAEAERDSLKAPITMQDVRLCAGEGKLREVDVLNAVNAILKRRSGDLSK